MSTTTDLQVVPSGTWTADKVHSDIAFAVNYLAGTFTGGSILFGTVGVLVKHLGC